MSKVKGLNRRSGVDAFKAVGEVGLTPIHKKRTLSAETRREIHARNNQVTCKACGKDALESDANLYKYHRSGYKCRECKEADKVAMNRAILAVHARRKK